MMATHAEKSGKKNLYKPSKERVSCKCHYLTLASFTYPVWNTVSLNPFAPEDFAENRVLKLVEWFSGHCRAIMS